MFQNMENQISTRFGNVETQMSNIVSLLVPRHVESLPTQKEGQTTPKGKKVHPNKKEGQTTPKGKKVHPNELSSNKIEEDHELTKFARFLEIFKKLHINIPFAEAIAQMPKYTKLLIEIISNKKKLEDFEMGKLNQECSALILKKLPPKLKDPVSFTIPCTIDNSHFEKSLCDWELLVDRSITHPRGIIEDVLIKVDKFIFPADFIVLDMEEDAEVPIILWRPFLATGKTLIDVQQGKLTLRLDLTNTTEEQLLRILKENKEAFGWTIHDIKGINRSICTHMIYMEDDSEPQALPQLRHNPNMQEVVKNEVTKLLDAVDLNDKEKTIFTCPYGTFSYKRKSFGLCNTHATFERCMSAIFSDLIEKCIEIFMDDFTEKLISAPIVVAFDWTISLELMCDASDTIVEVVLGRRKDKIFYTIYYASRTPDAAQKNFTTTEKDLLVIVFAFDKFQHYLVISKVVVYTNHATIKYLLGK
ncbi:uncharacterized protein [Cicer arietinum]|uniref:uncharacterized protein n=1 Tax=Cicer arietinum TaxID=3827 RepID=UPI003CC5C342